MSWFGRHYRIGRPTTSATAATTTRTERRLDSAPRASSVRTPMARRGTPRPLFPLRTGSEDVAYRSPICRGPGPLRSPESLAERSSRTTGAGVGPQSPPLGGTLLEPVVRPPPLVLRFRSSSGMDDPRGVRRHDASNTGCRRGDVYRGARGRGADGSGGAIEQDHTPRKRSCVGPFSKTGWTCQSFDRGGLPCLSGLAGR